MGLDIVELVIEVESVFKIDIPDRDASKLDTVGLLFDYMAAIVDPDQVGKYEGDLWTQYIDVVEKETGIARERLRPTARLVYDLDLD